MKNSFASLSWYLALACSCALYLASCKKPAPQGAGADWAFYLGDPASSQYSRLKQINRRNVHKLQLAWTFDTGDSAMYQTNNLIIDGMLYTASPHSRVFALDAATGEQRWMFDPSSVHDSISDYDQRGLMYWKGGENGRIFTMKGPYLYALHALSGELVSSFGQGGFIHLGEGLDVEGTPAVYLNTPGHIYHDMIIIGTNVPEDVPGAIRAFDVRTGERKWIFHSLPRPGEPGAETWPEGYLARTGGASDWSGISIDTLRGIVYASTETAGPDFYGGWRYGQNLYANSLIALDANTGERLWHQQLVHHDLWDLDLPAPPNLLTVMHQGKKVDVVAQGTKMGLLFVFDRLTGQPLWPIEERPTPKSRIEGLRTWPTQPFPTQPPPLMRQRYTPDDFSPISPAANQLTRDVYERSGNEGAYPPPSLEQLIMFPGYDGGMEWGGAAADPQGMLYVNVNEIPWFYQLVPTRQPDGSPLPDGELLYRVHCAACHGLERQGDPAGGFPSLDDVKGRLPEQVVMQLMRNGGGRMPAFERLSEAQKQAITDFLFGRKTAASKKLQQAGIPPYVFRGFQRFFDQEGYPAIKPPWGTLNAVDLNTGTIKWKVPLGEYEALTERGIAATGTENYGGPVVTAGGLLFIGATADAKFRAFDSQTGELLWQHELPFDGNATPSTYLANGRQYVVISCGNAKKKAVHGGMLVAFALP
ncbi:MAG: pyrroloquinoline quinone-dependent dehydrogenase [Bacteroidetes bacterium]|nr:MAG: pyrroloquinoline quinone-dependent dehydrogenase [Bacteroidota bacterium]